MRLCSYVTHAPMFIGDACAYVHRWTHASMFIGDACAYVHTGIIRVVLYHSYTDALYWYN